MAKASTKKPKLTPEEQMAELARLTGSVAAISHMGTSQPFVLPTPAPEATPTPAATAPESAPVSVEAAPPVPASKPEPSVPVAPVAASEPAPQLAAAPEPAGSAAPVEPKGEKPSPVVAPAPPAAPAAELPVADDLEEEEEVEVEAAPTPAATGDGKDKLDLTSLFADSAEKKTFQIRITASHQQFFQQMGLLLGGGASSTDVIHNILAQFKAANEAQIQKAFQRQLRQMMSPKK
ncbi:hypothetical protein [Hymenobacter properus]|uniref:Uncharacterized protein n=1 Tax=Hymenobacter properus TaxID=2791026 RepID=A0A931BN31_9BACT|nr:hypothetical protein [Hymenobacter properus]MBF9144457.1 hypothetical protein [Hymenobacter properus]MBR7723275.1 hypothetical protein [Microvirga sp. SRT04]